MSLAFKVDLSWWASASVQIASFAVPVVVVLGLFISWKYKRFSLTLTALAVYFGISILLAGISKISTESLLALLQNNTLYYFVFFMVVEPKSSPVFRNSRIAYGITAAVLLALLPLAVSMLPSGLTEIPQFPLSAIVLSNIFLVTILLSNLLGRVYEKLIK